MEKKPFHFDIDSTQEDLDISLGIERERTLELEKAFNQEIRRLIKEAQSEGRQTISSADLLVWCRDTAQTPAELVLTVYQVDSALRSLIDPFQAMQAQLAELLGGAGSEDISKVLN